MKQAMTFYLFMSHRFDPIRSNGLPHKNGGRVATMVMYCDTEGLVGGATNFGKAGVFVRPKVSSKLVVLTVSRTLLSQPELFYVLLSFQVGAAAFFSYLDSETHIHDAGFTTHSGCPVIEGAKRIAVHWIRIGVEAERPWDSFDTNNVQKSECEDVG